MSKYLILGLGLTGKSCLRYLHKQGKQCIAGDTRPEYQIKGLDRFKKFYPTIPVMCGDNLSLPSDVTTLVVSPGINLSHPIILSARAKGIDVIGDIELFARDPQVKSSLVIGITGSNGKSTVTSMLEHIASKIDIEVAVGGNLGIAALDLINPKIKIYILELSSFQLELTNSLSCYIATILNISADHLDRHKTLKNYVAAKHIIYNHAEHIIYNREDQNTIPLLLRGINFGTNPAKFSTDYGICDGYFMHGRNQLFRTNQINLIGKHNIINSLVAIAISQELAWELDTVSAALSSFQGLKHRCEKFMEYKGITWIDDSKATNVGATIACLQGLADNLKYKNAIIILGGDSKQADLRPLSEVVIKYCKLAIVYGKSKQDLQFIFPSQFNVAHAINFQDAVEIANINALPGDYVLLSPACSSLDSFTSFGHRGDTFKKLAKDIVTSYAD